jgi:hypothetical protein
MSLFHGDHHWKTEVFPGYIGIAQCACHVNVRGGRLRASERILLSHAAGLRVASSLSTPSPLGVSDSSQGKTHTHTLPAQYR